MAPFSRLCIVPFVALLLLVVSCRDAATREERPYTGYTVAPNSTVHKFAVAELKKFPDWATNSVLRGRADTQYQRDLQGFFSNEQSLRDVCFRCANVSEYGTGKYAVLLVDDEQEVNTVRLNVEVVGLIPVSFVAKLKEGEYYTFSGMYVKPLGGEAMDYIKYSVDDRTTLDVYNSDSVLYFGVAMYNIGAVSLCKRSVPTF
ncbi:MAG: hypothetical protein INR73_28170 [Williamsia sp.]|nr:hypothetical protein [Williamsia sp.]